MPDSIITKPPSTTSILNNRHVRKIDALALSLMQPWGIFVNAPPVTLI